jgi:glycosyltransferase involved in cell wall biosynthesis
LREWKGELQRFCRQVEFWELPERWKGVGWWLRAAVGPTFSDPLTCRAFWSPQVARTWRNTLEQSSAALVHFDSPDLAMLLPEAAGFPKVLNHHNCESAMAFRRGEREPNPIKKFYLRAEAWKFARLERKVCHLFDVNTAVSRDDAKLLQASNPQAHIHVVENGVDVDHFRSRGQPEETNALIFSGSLDWYANLSGIQFFLRDVWPILKSRRPDLRLYLAGKNPAGSLLRLAQESRDVQVVADPEDMRPWLERAAVFVCPILDGGGTRLKILDAMAMRKAVVSTTVGCEGLQVRHKENILVADAPADFAEGVLQLLENEALRRNLAAAGRMLVERQYSWERIGRELERAYRCALDRGSCTTQTGWTALS